MSRYHKNRGAARIGKKLATALLLALLVILAGCGAPAPATTQTAATPAKSQAGARTPAVRRTRTAVVPGSGSTRKAPAAARTSTARRTRTPTAPAPGSTGATPMASSSASGLPGALVLATPSADDRMETISYEELPPEAQDTLATIARGGPFKYQQDGVVFENREGLLPRRANGYYHEYTVETPGSADRGARRIIRGAQGEFYYTSDHYASFQRVLP